MACFTCGKSFNITEKGIIALYKGQYDKLGIERYVYRLSKGGSLKIVRKDGFSKVYESEIKPNLKNGAEYMHISEFTGA